MRSVPFLRDKNMLRKYGSVVAVGLVLSVAGCLLDNPDTPELEGPSMIGRSIELRAIPDSIVSDGFSSSVIEAILRGPNSERISGATINFELSRNGVFLDLGNLAPLNGARPTAGGVEAGPVSAVTDGDGVARARYWAPFRSDQENDSRVTIQARESGTNFRFAEQFMAQTDIFLRAANRPSFPGGSACDFIIEPLDLAYRVGEPIFVTATQDVGATGQPIARYEWDFGDRASRATGRNSGHVYTVSGSYTITLFTTESVSGNQANCSKDVEVTSSGAAPPPPTTTTTVPACSTPTAAFTPSGICSNGDVLADGATAALFDASSSSGGTAGETIASYTWSFGDGVTGTGVTASHAYAAALQGFSVTVSLTVRNSCGATAGTSDTFDLIAPPCP